MKSFVALALLVAVAAAAPPSLTADGAAEVLAFENSNIGTPDGYRTAYKTSNGIEAEEQAVFVPTKDGGYLQVKGQFQYFDALGNPHSLRYTADENGFQPESADIPTA